MASYSDAKDDLMNRLKKIEGQVKGIQRMVEEEQYCVDVLIQIAAVRAALDKVGMLVFENHTRKCLIKAIHEGKQDEMIDELLDVLKKFMK